MRLALQSVIIFFGCGSRLHHRTFKARGRGWPIACTYTRWFLRRCFVFSGVPARPWFGLQILGMLLPVRTSTAPLAVTLLVIHCLGRTRIGAYLKLRYSSYPCQIHVLSCLGSCVARYTLPAAVTFLVIHCLGRSRS